MTRRASGAAALGVVALTPGSTTRTRTRLAQQFSFGYTRQDALLICVAVPAAGFALQAALLAAGADSLTAGNTVLVVLVGGLSLVWAATYVQRVVNKDMTCAQQQWLGFVRHPRSALCSCLSHTFSVFKSGTDAKQLASYEEAVMAKRLEELPG